MFDDLHEEELHWDAEDIDIEDVFIQDDEEHSMSSESDESVGDKEVRGVELQGDFGGSDSDEVCLDRVQHGRGKALEIIHGSSSESYRFIPELREELLKANLGSVVQYELDVDHSFQRIITGRLSSSPCRMSGENQTRQLAMHTRVEPDAVKAVARAYPHES
ncbi:hypothetical protein QJS10_CPA02g00381 [Acorus calamus]|uniref:Uncharacterized protein n=1 Tax=Acorus calamus TaxID=4465 RepID=A0AAV9FE82_ACOCL|nr:hypothetical protein QJS10_CPA02g00381 [Acorus calamus]